MTKVGRKIRNGAVGLYRLARNGAICEVIYRATGTVVFEGTYAECNKWIGRTELAGHVDMLDGRGLRPVAKGEGSAAILAALVAVKSAKAGAP